MRGFSSKFKQSFFNNKNHFSFFNSIFNQNASKINFSNNLFYTRIINLTNSYTIASLINQCRIMSTALGTTAVSNESEITKLQINLNQSVTLLSELMACNDVCKLSSPGLLTCEIAIITKYSII